MTDILTTYIETAGATAQTAIESVTDVILGGQETVQVVAGHASAIPADVVEAGAQPAVEAAMAPFQTVKWLGLGVIGGALADEFLNGGRIRRSITG